MKAEGNRVFWYKCFQVGYHWFRVLEQMSFYYCWRGGIFTNCGYLGDYPIHTFLRFVKLGWISLDITLEMKLWHFTYFENGWILHSLLFWVNLSNIIYIILNWFRINLLLFGYYSPTHWLISKSELSVYKVLNRRN